eukprot:9784445-Prorocentrum_lima.AAC.1
MMCRRPPVSSGHVRGPMGAAGLEALRLGWKVLPDLTVETDLGLVFQLSEVAPHWLKALVRARW